MAKATPPFLNGVGRRTTIRNKIGHLVLAWSIGTATFTTCRARSIPALEFSSPVGGSDGTFETSSVTGPKRVCGDLS